MLYGMVFWGVGGYVAQSTALKEQNIFLMEDQTQWFVF